MTNEAIRYSFEQEQAHEMNEHQESFEHRNDESEHNRHESIQVNPGAGNSIKDILNATSELGLGSIGVAMSKLASANPFVRDSALSFMSEHVKSRSEDLGALNKLGDALQNSKSDAVKEAGNALKNIIELPIAAADFAGFITKQGEFTSEAAAKEELQKLLTRHHKGNLQAAINAALLKEYGNENVEINFQAGSGQRGEAPATVAQITNTSLNVLTGKEQRVKTGEIKLDGFLKRPAGMR